MLPSVIPWRDGVLLLVLLSGFWLVDLLFRREHLSRSLARLRVRSPFLQMSVLMLLAAGLALVWPWQRVPDGALLRVFALVLAGVLTWKAATEDIDVPTGEPLWAERLLLVLATAGVAFSPAFVVPALLGYTTAFAAWRHHATAPLRLLQLTLAFSVIAALSAPLGWRIQDAGLLLYVALVIQVSHYLITALAKGFLGPKWYSWILDNRLHHLAASAYSWGWARFVSPALHQRFVRFLRFAEKPFQGLAFGLEALVPLALLDPTLAVVFLIGLMGFQLVVFASSGILFWEWMVVNGGLIGLIALLPEAVLSRIFGLHGLIVGLAIMFVWPFRGKLWKPTPLGWWDTPLTQRVHWQVQGESGRWYGLYNDFLCPHERLYGRVHGAFLVKTPLFTYHLGEVWKHELRDTIRAAQTDPAALDRARERWGIEVYDHALAEQHLRYLRTLFERLNRGERKSVLPAGMRWLKAPGGQFYYWGDLPGYRRQEPVKQLRAFYREQLYDGEAIRTLRDEEVARVDIHLHPEQVDVAREVSEAVLEAHLLSCANGVLVDVPQWVTAKPGAPAAAVAPSGPPADSRADGAPANAVLDAGQEEVERAWQVGADPSATGAP